MAKRAVRYQAAIVEADRLLLIRFRDPVSKKSFWLVPGGGLEPGETEEECVVREVLEETNLVVKVDRFLLEHEDPAGVYPRLKTYLCRIVSGQPTPGYEPGPPIPADCGIIETGWVYLGQPDTWDEEIRRDKITMAVLHQLQQALSSASEI